MCTPKGCTLYNVCARVRVYVKPRRGNLGQKTRELGQNYRVTFYSVPRRDYFSLRAPAGPLIPEGDMGTLSGTHFSKQKVNKFNIFVNFLEFPEINFICTHFTRDLHSKHTDTNIS